MSLDGVPLTVWVLVPFVASGLFGAVAPVLARRLAPWRATWLLSAGSLVLAGSSLVVLALVVFTAAGQLPALAALGHWSWHLVHAGQPFDEWATAVALVLLGGQLALLARAGLRRGRALAAAWASCRAVPGPLVVLPDSGRIAFAVPGWPGRIVASRGLLEALTPAQRRAVLAHEQAHLDFRHDLHLTVAALAVAADPLLLGIPPALRLATERWADEVAARATGDRYLVAATIGSAATEPDGPGPFGALTLGLGAEQVGARIGALLACPPRRHLVLESLLAILAFAAAASALIAVHDVGEIFQAAHHAYAAAAGPV